MVSEQEVNRMRWAARRGMLELDLVLAPFVNACYSDLNKAERQDFERLMVCEDQELFAWFLRKEVPEDEGLADIVSKVLEFSRTPDEGRPV